MIYGRKFAGIIIMRNLDKEIIVRKTYEFVNMMSDVGGLFSFLLRIGMILIPWLSDFWLNNFLF